MKYYLIEDSCVMCGAYVPEGVWVCPNCIKKIEAKPSPETNRQPTLYRRKKNGSGFLHLIHNRNAESKMGHRDLE
ncbi:MAG: hypothetical protein LUD16_01835 [Lachnospiraceae bacterium]|nr:hypothetical protein [Lachnospiraceae bacterium]